MSDDETRQAVVEEVDALLQEALRHANRHLEHDEVRPSAMLSFDAVENARENPNPDAIEQVGELL